MLEIALYTIVFLITGLCLLASLFIGASVIAIFFTKVPFAPTPQRNIEQVMQHFNLQPGQIFYDLGCGDGRFLLAAEQKGAKAIGFEISPWAYFRGRFNLWRHKSQAKIIFKNFYYQNISDADAVFCFLIDTVMPKVEKKLREELKPDAKIICYGFKLPTWPPVEIIEVKKGFSKSSKIYLYQKS